MASGVTRVIERCDTAVATEHLDLSECQLVQMPDAVFHLMRNTVLKTCDLSSNVITKIPPKLPLKFSAITVLNVSHNRISKLPEEIRELKSLTRLDISHNAFLNMPSAVYTLPQLRHLETRKNHIEDVDWNSLQSHEQLKTVDLRENPLSLDTHTQLGSISSITVLLSPIVQQEWEVIPES